VVARDDALAGEHRCVRLACRDVLAIKAAIEVDRGVDLLHNGAGARGKPPAPHLVAHDTAESCLMTDRPKRLNRFTSIALGVAVGAAVGLAAVYGISAMQRNPTEAACKPAGELAKRLAPPARGAGGGGRAARAARPAAA